MGMKDNLRDSAAKGGLSPGRNIWSYSRSYKKYFEGYSETYVPRASGRGMRIERTYTGEWYCQDLTRREQILVRLLYSCLFSGVLLLFLPAACMRFSGNDTVFVGISQAVCVPFLFWFLYAFVFYIPINKKWTIDEYRSAVLGVKRSACGTGVCLAAAGVVMLGYILGRGEWNSLESWAYIARCLTGSGFMFFIYYRERLISYIKLPAKSILYLR